MQEHEEHARGGDEPAEADEEVRPDGSRGEGLAEDEPVPEKDVQPGGARGEGLAGDT